MFFKILDSIKDLKEHNEGVRSQIQQIEENISNLGINSVDEMKIRVFSSSSNPLFKFCMLALSDSNLLRISIQMLGRNSFAHRSFSLTHFEYFSSSMPLSMAGAPDGNFRENICSEDDLRTRIFGTFVVKFLACLPLLGFSNGIITHFKRIFTLKKAT